MRHAAEHVASTVRRLILAGDLPSGSRLGEAELASRLDVSRTPIREALSRLAAEGLVDLVPNRGARVVTWTPDALQQIFQLRLRLEPYAVSLAVPRLTADQIAELDELARLMVKLGRRGVNQDLDSVVQLNRQFHDLLIESAANPVVASSLKAVTHAAVIHQNFHDYTPSGLTRSLAHHGEIVAAARVGDADWAASVMRSHLYNARAAMLPAHQSETDDVQQDKAKSS